MFYIGSLESASQEAFYGKARDVSKLFDYLGPQLNVVVVFSLQCGNRLKTKVKIQF